MIVEFRSSDPSTCCRECGAPELIHTTTGAALTGDLEAMTRYALDRLAHELVELWEEEKVSLSEVSDYEVRRVRDEINRAHAEFEERVTALLGERAPAVRVVKRRWQTHLDARFQELVQDLRSKTVKT